MLVFFPFKRGYYLDRYMLPIVSTKNIIYFARWSSNYDLSPLSNEKLPNYIELELKVNGLLDDYMSLFEDDKLKHRGVSIPSALKRELKLFLVEYYNKIYQIKSDN